MTKTQLCQWYNISMRNGILEFFVMPKRQDEGVGIKVQESRSEMVIDGIAIRKDREEERRFRLIMKRRMVGSIVPQKFESLRFCSVDEIK